jgi:hypothetical protein
METKCILTFELRYNVYNKNEDSTDYKCKKYTIGEFNDFNKAVTIGNEFIKNINLDHPSTPGINGDRLGTAIFGNVKNSLVHNYLRDSKGQKVGEIFIKISKVNCMSLEESIEICKQFKQ